MAKPLNKIVVGSSLEPPSDAVVASALGLARLAGAKLHVAHAYVPPMPYVGDPFPVAWASNELLVKHEDDLRRALAEQAARAGAEAGEVAGYHLSQGPAHIVLEEIALDLGAELVVVGSAESGSRLGRKILGSTADRLLRHARRPVLLARGPFGEPPRRVLLPVDFSPPSTEAFAWGLELLREVCRERWPAVEALFVLLPFPQQVPLQFTPEQVSRLAADELERLIAEHAEPATVRPRARSGKPTEEILAEIEERSADLVILGTHGRSGIERYLLGSVACEVAREANVSVLVVPPRAR